MLPDHTGINIHKYTYTHKYWYILSYQNDFVGSNYELYYGRLCDFSLPNYLISMANKQIS